MARLSVAQRAVGARRFATSRARALFPILWASDSIANMPTLWQRVSNGLPAYDVEHETGTYGGNVIGGGLLEVADETQAYIDGAWAVRQRGSPFSRFSAFVFCFGRNDSGANEDLDAFRKAYDKLVAQGLRYFPKMVSVVPPPVAAANLLAWNLAGDSWPVNGHQDEAADVLTKWGQRNVDCWVDFQTLATAGTYTIAQLMRDTLHPHTLTGADVMADGISAALLTPNTPNAATDEVAGRVVNYLFGEPTVGTWEFRSTTAVQAPTLGPVPRISGLADIGIAASGTGSKLVFPTVEADQVWVQWYRTASTGGNFTCYVDRGLPSEQSVAVTTLDTQNNYPKSTLVAWELAAGEHTIEIETTSAGPVCIMGVTVVGAV